MRNNQKEVPYLKKKKDEITIRSSAAEYLTYVASVGDQQDSIEMRYEDENIWLTQKMMATLYDVDVRTINYHVKKIFSDSELQEDSVIRKFRITAADGKSYSTNHYSLEMIIAVGFKVNSERAVQFRKWVNQIAKDYTIKGWVMDDERLKRGTYLTEKYFDEQLERIREIRASERKFYQKITDLYATAIDYDKNSATTRRFYATVQNKMHYAVHGHTAAELIVERADHTREHMGLTTWADAPEGKIKKSDVTVAKNYLSQDEMKQLNRMVTAYLDFAENMTLRHIPLTMQDWEKRLNSFIEMFDYGILQDAGKAAPAYYLAKNTIELINAVAKKVNNDKRINDKIKVVFLENYRVSLAEKIIPATDLSEQISTTTKEASGTSNMKFMMNGAVTIATLDGANIEIRDEVGDDNIVIFGLTENEVLDYYSRGGYSAWDVRNNDNRLIKVTDDLISGVYSKDRDKFRSVYDNLLTYNDEFFVLKDFDSYLKAQDKVDLRYSKNSSS